MPTHLSYLVNLGHFVPELIISLTMVCLVFAEATYGGDEESRPMIFWVSLLGPFVACVLLFLGLGETPVVIFTNSLVIDSFSGFSKIIMIIGTVGAIGISRVSKDISYDIKSEFAIMAMGILLGGMLLVSANNMLVFYIAIEMLSILSYVMASMKKNDEYSSEAGLKYALYGGVASGFMLFGMSHIFGLLGTIHFDGIAAGVVNLDRGGFLVLAPSFLLFFVGIGYKMACVPFHMWAPDVYEGSPTPVTAFFAIVPKVAAISALVRVSFVFFDRAEQLQHFWISLIQVVSILTMTVGNISAIGQKSVKRMLAYSSISHAGMMLLSAVVLDVVGTSALLFYGFVYLFMTLVAFAVTAFVGNHFGNDHFERFNGLLFKHPLPAVLMGLVMFSLAGIPPFAGFVAKFNIIAAVIEKKYYVLAIFALLNSVISLYYYLRIVRCMVLRPCESDERIKGFSFLHSCILSGVGLPIIFFGVFWSKLYGIVRDSTLFLDH